MTIERANLGKTLIASVEHRPYSLAI